MSFILLSVNYFHRYLDMEPDSHAREKVVTWKMSNLTCDEFFERLEQLLQSDIRNSFNEIRKILNLAKKKVLKEIAFHILERDKYHFHEEWFQWYHYILDIIDQGLK